jgi:hypothetical protein
LPVHRKAVDSAYRSSFASLLVKSSSGPGGPLTAFNTVLHTGVFAAFDAATCVSLRAAIRDPVPSRLRGLRSSFQPSVRTLSVSRASQMAVQWTQSSTASKADCSEAPKAGTTAAAMASRMANWAASKDDPQAGYLAFLRAVMSRTDCLKVQVTVPKADCLVAMWDAQSVETMACSRVATSAGLSPPHFCALTTNRPKAAHLQPSILF